MKKFLIVTLFTLACVSMSLASSTGESIYKKCKGCHGKSGEKMAMKVSPILKGQSAADIENKLKGYADGSYGGKKKALMVKQAKKLSPADIKAVSNYIASF